MGGRLPLSLTQTVAPPTPPDADEHGLDIDAIFFLKITNKRRPSSQNADERGNIHFGTIMIQMAWEPWLTVSDGVGVSSARKASNPGQNDPVAYTQSLECLETRKFCLKRMTNPFL